MTIEVNEKERAFVDAIRQLSQRGCDYIMEKIRVVKTWENFVSKGGTTESESN